MQPQVTHELNDADERILQVLTDGRNLPQNLAERLDYSRQYVQNRLQMLKAADYVSRRGGGLYEITDDGREEIGIEKESETNVAELRARLQDALDDRDDAQARADRLADELQDCREELE